MSNKAKPQEGRKKKKVKYPRLSSIETFEIVKKAVKDYGDRIIPYSEFAKILGFKEPKGGTYSVKTEALKLYNLMDRVSFNEIGVTPNGRRILDAPPSEQKKLLFESTISIGIFADLFQRFPKLPTKRKAIINYLMNKGLNRYDAGRIVTVFIKNHKEFASFILPMALRPREHMPETSTLEGINQSLPNFFYLIGSLFPSRETRDLKQALTALTEVSKNKNWKATSALLESLNAIYSDEKDTNRIKEGLEKARRLIFQKLEEDLGIKFELEGSDQ